MRREIQMADLLDRLDRGGWTDEERARMWPILTAAHKNYAGYQTKTTREIPLVLLEPTP